jgi:GNAT superfamily N-acetyltransferase
LGLSVRRAGGGDVETLLTIQREAAVVAFAHVFPQDLYPFPSDDIRGHWREIVADEDGEVYLAEEDGEALGSVSIGGEFLRTLYVRPQAQGTGIGSRLHDMALERLGKRGCKHAKLWTLEENWPARKFYENRGWRLTDVTRMVPFPPYPVDVQYEKEL